MGLELPRQYPTRELGSFGQVGLYHLSFGELEETKFSPEEPIRYFSVPVMVTHDKNLLDKLNTPTTLCMSGEPSFPGGFIVIFSFFSLAVILNALFIKTGLNPLFNEMYSLFYLLLPQSESIYYLTMSNS